MTEGHVTPKGSLKGCTHAQPPVSRLRNIHYSGAFSLEMTSSNVTTKGFTWECADMRNRKLRNKRSNISCRASPGSHVIGSALVVFSRTSASYYRFLALSLVICPFLRHFYWGAPSIITFFTNVCCFRICCVVHQVVYHVHVAFLLYFQRSFNVLFINCSFLLYCFVNFLSITTFLDSFL